MNASHILQDDDRVPYVRTEQKDLKHTVSLLTISISYRLPSILMENIYGLPRHHYSESNSLLLKNIVQHIYLQQGIFCRNLCINIYFVNNSIFKFLADIKKG